MQQNSLDDAVLLGQFSHVDKLLIGIAVVCLDDIGHPRRRRGSIRLVVLFIEQFNFAAGYRNIYDTNSDFFRKVGNQCSAKIIGGTKTGGTAA